ncbi:ABC transporter substrate-binding protein [Nocardioides sp. BGMRC 2183]|nr:ABC transporter substrate-binding protein [Nocardioides sp. BGMRC 2183]
MTRGFRKSAAVVAGLASVLALGACGAEDSGEENEAASTTEVTDEFPITIEHAFGETTIEEAPERVATWGWGSTEAAISVGVYPVAIAEQIWTVGEGNLLPWVEEAYDEAGVEHPTVLSDAAGGEEIVYDEFIEAKPDVILAPYSGMTEEQYKELSKYAPVVPFQDAAWTTPWDKTIELTAEALGRSEKGEEVLDGIDSYLAEQAEAHPEFEGTSIAAIWAAPNSLSVYTGLDPRVAIFTDLGFEVAPSVDELDTSDGGFYYDMSYEKADQLASDVVVSYHSTQDEADAMLADKKAQAIPAVKNGQVALVIGNPQISSVSPPTALTFEWEEGLPTLIDQLSGLLKD